jgi:PadR family transcriptional regulator, regulatory protein PadR
MTTDTQNLAKRVNELLVLSSLREGARHGYQIALDVEERSGGAFELQHGTLYPILHRLEKEGLIRGEWTEGVGRQRKEYELTRAGQRYLEEQAGEVRGAFEQLILILGESGRGQLRARPATG